jgi:competence protein ComEC
VAALICLSGLIFIAIPERKIRLLLACAAIPLVLGFREEKPDLSILVFDVGQGTSVLIEQPEYTLLYDTGPAFSSQFNAGKDILLPHIQRGARQLDVLIVSHDDSDHSGGFPYLRDELEIGKLFVGGENSYRDAPYLNPQYCRAEMAWSVGQVDYRFLHPRELSNLRVSNNKSCVLLIEFAGKKILLAGDIEKNVEAELLEVYPDLTDIDWLLIPHHGSKTSSSESFVDRVAPDIAVVSAGYGNSFGHPAEEVVARYVSVGSEILATSDYGALRFVWVNRDSDMEWRASRGLYRFWWQE